MLAAGGQEMPLLPSVAKFFQWAGDNELGKKSRFFATQNCYP